MEESYKESLDKLREALDEEDEDAFLELAHAVPASNWEIPAFSYLSSDARDAELVFHPFRFP